MRKLNKLVCIAGVWLLAGCDQLADKYRVEFRDGSWREIAITPFSDEARWREGCATGEVLIDSLGRRSYTTSVAYGPTIGKNIALAYLPADYCEVGRKLNVEYFAETYPVEVAAVGYKPLYDPENLKPRS